MINDKLNNEFKNKILTDDQILLKKILSPLEFRHDLLIEHLHKIQDHFGYLSEKNLSFLAEFLNLSKVEVYEVASFYAHFDLIKEGDIPPPKTTIRVCNSLSCNIYGSGKLKNKIIDKFQDQDIRVMDAPCMGRCASAPVLEIGHFHVEKANLEKVSEAIEKKWKSPIIPNYQSFDDYINKGGYKKYREIKDRLDVWYDDIIKADLRGLGGAGFRTAKKWEIVSKENGTKYLAVNGDEGEPGTFKDKHYLEKEPHMFLEGMLMAATSINAKKCFIYIRDEYPAVLEILKNEITKLEKEKIVPLNYIDMRRGAGAYICGEESAMIESIEGKRGLPRHRPPYVGQSGIFGKPTLVHNVETLYWVARIMREGPEIFTDFTKNNCIGLRSYSVSGRVKKPGLYLLPSGSTILDIIEASGGMIEGHKFKAYQPGGASSGILPATINNIPLDFDTLEKYDTFIGSAAVVVLSDKDKIRDVALNMIEFFKSESCGQCTPCRVGCEKAVSIMKQKVWDMSLLKDLCEVMESASICGLGQAATKPIKSSISYFSKELRNE